MKKFKTQIRQTDLSYCPSMVSDGEGIEAVSAGLSGYGGWTEQEDLSRLSPMISCYYTWWPEQEYLRWCMPEYRETLSSSYASLFHLTS